MGRKAKDGRYVNVNISSAAIEALERHCLTSGQTKTTAVERAILACYGGSGKNDDKKGGALCRNRGNDR